MAKTNREGKSHLEHDKSSMLDGNKKDRDNGRSSRHPLELRSKSTRLEGVGHKEENMSVDTLFNNIVSRAEAKQGRPS